MTRTMLATLALGAAVAFAGPAFAEKMKATLDGKSEVPATTTSGTGTADIDYDPATKKLTWKLTYSGLTGPATAAHFHGPAEAGKNAGVKVPIPNATSSPADFAPSTFARVSSTLVDDPIPMQRSADAD